MYIAEHYVTSLFDRQPVYTSCLWSCSRWPLWAASQPFVRLFPTYWFMQKREAFSGKNILDLLTQDFFPPVRHPIAKKTMVQISYQSKYYLLIYKQKQQKCQLRSTIKDQQSNNKTFRWSEITIHSRKVREVHKNYIKLQVTTDQPILNIKIWMLANQ